MYYTNLNGNSMEELIQGLYVQYKFRLLHNITVLSNTVTYFVKPASTFILSFPPVSELKY